MVGWGFSPSVRLFEAAACGCPIVSDDWPGLGTIFRVGDEVLLAQTGSDVISLLSDAEDAQLRRIGQAARQRVLSEHTATRRAEEFENYVGASDPVRTGHSLTGALNRVEIPQNSLANVLITNEKSAV
jgi:spore maturation protein CgeB